MKEVLYPLLFEPILKDRIWGGTKLQSLLHKDIVSDTTGESWELSGVEGDISIVKNGALKGIDLQTLIEQYQEELLGKSVFQKFGKQFPLLFKFLDAKEDLSIQLHPSDELAKKRHNSFGKTEMWYVMQADEGAKLIVGFKEKSSPEAYLKHLQAKTMRSILDEVAVQEGDVFFLETGTLHAIGKGTVIAEIQQSSDVTYRVYDFDRKDANGNLRELHVDLALEAINYDTVSAKKEYDAKPNVSNEMVHCPYFTTSIIPLQGEVAIQHDKSSFRVYMCVDGEVTIIVGEEKFCFSKGDTFLMPAFISDYQFVGSAKLLEIFIS